MVQLNSKPALLIIDMQNGFCHDEGTFSKMGFDITYTKGVIRAVEKLRSICRELNIPVLYTKMGRAADNSDGGFMHWQDELGAGGFVRGTFDTEIVDELKPSRSEKVIEKTRYSAFIRTPLEEIIEEEKLNHLIATGVGTNVCVDCTVRDAWQK